MEHQITISLTHEEAAMIVGALDNTGRRDCAHLADRLLLQCLEAIDKEAAGRSRGGISLRPLPNLHPLMGNGQKTARS